MIKKIWKWVKRMFKKMKKEVYEIMNVKEQIKLAKEKTKMTKEAASAFMNNDNVRDIVGTIVTATGIGVVIIGIAIKSTVSKNQAISEENTPELGW